MILQSLQKLFCRLRRSDSMWDMSGYSCVCSPCLVYTLLIASVPYFLSSSNTCSFQSRKILMVVLRYCLQKYDQSTPNNFWGCLSCMWPSKFISLVASTTDLQEITSLFLKLLMILHLFLAHMSSSSVLSFGWMLLKLLV